MSIIKLNWGARIALLYVVFVGLIVTLVVASMRQSFDLVTPDYYDQELKYQDVIDAGKNQATLSSPIVLEATEQVVNIKFPDEFRGNTLKGTVLFYSPINSTWDKKFDIVAAGNAMTIPRTAVRTTNYKVKIAWETSGKKYYQESELNLSK
jgi:hypothetical protein